MYRYSLFPGGVDLLRPAPRVIPLDLVSTRHCVAEEAGHLRQRKLSYREGRQYEEKRSHNLSDERYFHC